jgi:hypothetical protein
MNQTTEGFLSSILNDEDLQLMDMAMNEGKFSLQFCRWLIYFFAWSDCFQFYDIQLLLVKEEAFILPFTPIDT